MLVVSNNAEAGALRRAKRSGIPTAVSGPKDFSTPDEYCAQLAQLCREKGVELICLAGFMLHLKPSLLKAFPWRILNIHPALLPSFGGKGMYGHFVHEAVIGAGEKESGCTVHVVDEEYDHGPTVLQRKIPVLPEDTPESLAQKVLKEEHVLYPEAIQAFIASSLKT